MFRCYQSLLTSQMFPTSGTDPQQAQFFFGGLYSTSMFLTCVAYPSHHGFYSLLLKQKIPKESKAPTLLRSPSSPSSTQPPAGGAPPPPAARGGLSGREEAAAQVSVSRGQRRAPGGARCKESSLVPCAPWRRQIHHHRRGGARGGNEGEALAQRPGPSRSTRPEHRRDGRPRSPQRRDPQA